MTTDNEALVSRLWEQIWIRGEFDDVDALIADPYIRHTRAGTTTLSPSAYASHISSATRTTRGTKVTIVDIASADDMVFARLHLDAVNLETGNTVRLTWLTQYRIADGKVAESWTLHQSGLDW